MYRYGEKSFRYGNLDDLTVFTNKGTRMAILRGSFPSERFGHRDTRYCLCGGLSGERPVNENYFVLKASEITALHDLLERMIDAEEIVDELSDEKFKECSDNKHRRDWVRNHANWGRIEYR